MTAGVSAEGPRDVVVLMERDRAESRSCRPLVDYFATILPPVQNCLTTIWPFIEILRLIVQATVTMQRWPIKICYNVSQGSVATSVRCGGIFSYSFIMNSLLSPQVKKI